MEREKGLLDYYDVCVYLSELQDNTDGQSAEKTRLPVLFIANGKL